MLAVPAVAEDAVMVSGQRTAPGSVFVPIGDLNLSAATDVAQMHTRVKLGAREACAKFGVHGKNARTWSHACPTDAYNAARPQMLAAISQAGAGVAAGAIRLRISR
jgi:UrcA family protein